MASSSVRSVQQSLRGRRHIRVTRLAALVTVGLFGRCHSQMSLDQTDATAKVVARRAVVAAGAKLERHAEEIPLAAAVRGVEEERGIGAQCVAKLAQRRLPALDIGHALAELRVV